MAVPGADSSVPVSTPHIELAQEYLKQQPAFWGRYFNGYHTADAEYQQEEAELFANMQMRLLPIAQQTPRVAGTRDEGAAHATMNVEKFIDRVGLEWLASAGSEYVMFLDVEGERVGGNPSLSSEYYVGWSTSLVETSRTRSDGRFVILPAVYGRAKDDATWNALVDGENAGATPCVGIWITRQRKNACNRPIPDWDEPFITPAIQLRCPVVCWQFAIDCPNADGVDLNALTPDYDARAVILDRLIIPARANTV